MINNELENNFTIGYNNDVIMQKRANNENLKNLSSDLHKNFQKTFNISPLKEIGNLTNEILGNIHKSSTIQNKILNSIDNKLEKLIKTKLLENQSNQKPGLLSKVKENVLGSYYSDDVRERIVKTSKGFSDLHGNLESFTETFKRISEEQLEKTEHLMAMFAKVPETFTGRMEIALNKFLMKSPFMVHAMEIYKLTLGGMVDWGKQLVHDIIKPMDSYMRSFFKYLWIPNVLSMSKTGKWMNEVDIAKGMPLESIISVLSGIHKNTWLLNHQTIPQQFGESRKQQIEIYDKGPLKRFLDATPDILKTLPVASFALYKAMGFTGEILPLIKTLGTGYLGLLQGIGMNLAKLGGLFWNHPWFMGGGIMLLKSLKPLISYALDARSERLQRERRQEQQRLLEQQLGYQQLVETAQAPDKYGAAESFRETLSNFRNIISDPSAWGGWIKNVGRSIFDRRAYFQEQREAARSREEENANNVRTAFLNRINDVRFMEGVRELFISRPMLHLDAMSRNTMSVSEYLTDTLHTLLFEHGNGFMNMFYAILSDSLGHISSMREFLTTNNSLTTLRSYLNDVRDRIVSSINNLGNNLSTYVQNVAAPNINIGNLTSQINNLSDVLSNDQNQNSLVSVFQRLERSSISLGERFNEMFNQISGLGVQSNTLNNDINQLRNTLSTFMNNIGGTSVRDPFTIIGANEEPGIGLAASTMTNLANQLSGEDSTSSFSDTLWTKLNTIISLIRNRQEPPRGSGGEVAPPRNPRSGALALVSIQETRSELLKKFFNEVIDIKNYILDTKNLFINNFKTFIKKSNPFFEIYTPDTSRERKLLEDAARGKLTNIDEIKADTPEKKSEGWFSGIISKILGAKMLLAGLGSAVSLGLANYFTDGSIWKGFKGVLKGSLSGIQVALKDGIIEGLKTFLNEGFYENIKNMISDVYEKGKKDETKQSEDVNLGSTGAKATKVATGIIGDASIRTLAKGFKDKGIGIVDKIKGSKTISYLNRAKDYIAGTKTFQKIKDAGGWIGGKLGSAKGAIGARAELLAKAYPRLAKVLSGGKSFLGKGGKLLTKGGSKALGLLSAPLSTILAGYDIVKHVGKTSKGLGRLYENFTWENIGETLGDVGRGAAMIGGGVTGGPAGILIANTLYDLSGTATKYATQKLSDAVDHVSKKIYGEAVDNLNTTKLFEAAQVFKLDFRSLKKLNHKDRNKIVKLYLAFMNGPRTFDHWKMHHKYISRIVKEIPKKSKEEEIAEDLKAKSSKMKTKLDAKSKELKNKKALTPSKENAFMNIVLDNLSKFKTTISDGAQKGRNIIQEKLYGSASEYESHNRVNTMSQGVIASAVRDVEEVVASPTGSKEILLRSPFGKREHVKVGRKLHRGNDIVAKLGDPVYAMMGGIAYHGSKGDNVIVKHGKGLESRYIHVVPTVRNGAHVHKGDLIAKVGYYHTSPHLHFEVLKNGKYIDPATFLKNVSDIELKIDFQYGSKEDQEKRMKEAEGIIIESEKVIKDKNTLFNKIEPIKKKSIIEKGKELINDKISQLKQSGEKALEEQKASLEKRFNKSLDEITFEDIKNVSFKLGGDIKKSLQENEHVKSTKKFLNDAKQRALFEYHRGDLSKEMQSNLLPNEYASLFLKENKSSKFYDLNKPLYSIPKVNKEDFLAFDNSLENNLKNTTFKLVGDVKKSLQKNLESFKTSELYKESSEVGTRIMKTTSETTSMLYKLLEKQTQDTKESNQKIVELLTDINMTLKKDKNSQTIIGGNTNVTTIKKNTSNVSTQTTPTRNDQPSRSFNLSYLD